jgi:hypothetical protein
MLQVFLVRCVSLIDLPAYRQHIHVSQWYSRFAKVIPEGFDYHQIICCRLERRIRKHVSQWYSQSLVVPEGFEYFQHYMYTGNESEVST